MSGYLHFLKFKYILIAAVIFSFSQSETHAQAELFGFGGWMVSSNVPVREGDLVIDNDASFGLGLDYSIQKEMAIELIWIGNQTSASIRRFKGGTDHLFDVGIHYFQVGAVYDFRQRKNQKAYPFTSVTMGATLFDAKSATVNDEWRFSVTLGVGGKFLLTKNIGLRLQARLLMPLNFSGAGFWCGTGGCGVSVGSWTPFVQADFTGGVFIRLGK